MVDEVRLDRRCNRSMIAPSDLGTGIQVVQGIRTVLGIDMHAMSAILRFRSPSRDPGIRNLWNILRKESSNDRRANVGAALYLGDTWKKRRVQLQKRWKEYQISSNYFSITYL